MIRSIIDQEWVASILTVSDWFLLQELHYSTTHTPRFMHSIRHLKSMHISKTLCNKCETAAVWSREPVGNKGNYRRRSLLVRFQWFSNSSVAYLEERRRWSCKSRSPRLFTPSIMTLSPATAWLLISGSSSSSRQTLLGMSPSPASLPIIIVIITSFFIHCLRFLLSVYCSGQKYNK